MLAHLFLVLAVCTAARPRSTQPYTIPATTGDTTSLLMVPCEGTSRDSTQQWIFKSDGTLSLLSDPGQCVLYGGDGVPLVLTPCNGSNPSQQWVWDGGAGAVRLHAMRSAEEPHPLQKVQTNHLPQPRESVCFNVRTLPGPSASPGDVGGYYPCTPSQEPHNEVFALDPRGRLVSKMDGPWAGQCVAARAHAPSPAPPPPPPPSDGLNIWPMPRSSSASGSVLMLAAGFYVEYTGGSKVAAAAAVRYTTMLHANKTATAASRLASNGALNQRNATALSKLTLLLESTDDAFTNWTTNESYSIVIEGGSAVATAATPVGGLRVRFQSF